MDDNYYTAEDREDFIVKLPPGTEVMITYQSGSLRKGEKVVKVGNSRNKNAATRRIIVRSRTLKRYRTFTLRADWFTCDAWEILNKMLDRQEVPF